MFPSAMLIQGISIQTLNPAHHIRRRVTAWAEAGFFPARR
jgi:hypothetical protein